MTKRVGALAAAVALLFAVFLLAVRPWYLSWGATQDELTRDLPGDEIVADAPWQETRAITIHAPTNRTWPWLAQLGQDRGGFYSYDLLENLVGCRMPTTDTLRPGKQQWQLGDRLWMYPSDKAGGTGYATLRTYLPGRALGFGTHVPGTSATAPEGGSWLFYIEPIDGGSTRLIVRGMGAPGRSLLGVAFDRSIFEPMHFVMERRMMIGLKDVAETGSRSRVSNHAQVALWTLIFFLMLWRAYRVVRGDSWNRDLAAFVACAAVFQYLCFVQPPVWIGAMAVAALCVWSVAPRPAGAMLTRNEGIR